MKGGGGLASIQKLKKEVMSIIDVSSPIEVQKANDYIYDVEMMRRLQRLVREDGETTVIKNGAQEYTKEHPAMNQIDKISKRLRAFEKEFLEAKSPSSVVAEEEQQTSKRTKLT